MRYTFQRSGFRQNRIKWNKTLFTTMFVLRFDKQLLMICFATLFANDSCDVASLDLELLIALPFKMLVFKTYSYWLLITSVLFEQERHNTPNLLWVIG